MIAIIDYGAGNLFSVKNALDYLQIENCVTEKAEIIRRADGLILPGVGAFPDAMERLERKQLVSVIQEEAARNPFWESVWECSFCLKKAGNLRRQKDWA